MHPSCSCPDFSKGNVCKHILFVMVRVIRLAPDDPLIWQKALLRSEVSFGHRRWAAISIPMTPCSWVASRAVQAEDVVSGRRSTRAVDAEVSASHAVREQWQRTQSGSMAAVKEEKDSNQRELAGECPICYDGFSQKEDVVWCKSCGNNIHRSCFANWAKAKTAARAAVTCVYCRAVWDMDKSNAQDADAAGGQYVNLRQFSEAHADTDVSLDSLYGDSAVWIRNAGSNRRSNAALYSVGRGAL